MKLYYSKGACSLAVRITLHELGVACEFEAVNLQTKKTETGADYLQINSRGAVPALMLDNQQILTENTAIQQYLTDQYHATQLLPALNDFQRYRVLEWLGFINSDLHKSISLLFNAAIPQALKEELFIPNVKNKLKFIDQHLAQNSYLMAGQFTIADSYLFVILTWLPHFKLALADWPHLARYVTDLKNRKSVQLALQEESLA